MKKNQAIILMSAAMITLAACSTEERYDSSFDNEVKTELVEKDKLPTWLAGYIDYIEYVPEEQSLSDKVKFGVYRFKWEGETYYELYFPLWTMMHENIYKSDGTPILLSNQDYTSFSEGAGEWTIVYLGNQSHRKPEDCYYASSQVSYRIDDPLTRDPADCYIVNNEEELQLLSDGFVGLPEIDYSINTLLVGQILALQNSELKRQEVRTEDGVPALYLYFEERLHAASNPSQDTGYYYFWAIYPKLLITRMNIKVFYNNHPLYEPECMVNIPGMTKYDYPAFHYEEDGTLVIENMQPISDADFQKYVVGRGWKSYDRYRMESDGTLYDTSYLLGEGYGVSAYLFSEGAAIAFVYNSTHSAYDQQVSSMYYDEATNEVFFDGTPRMRLISVSENKIVAVTYAGSAIVDGVVRDVFEIGTYLPMSDKKLSEMTQLF